MNAYDLSVWIVLWSRPRQQDADTAETQMLIRWAVRTGRTVRGDLS